MMLILQTGREGFTFIEVLIVIIIIGIVSSLIIPSFGLTLSGIEDRLVREKTINLFKQARAEAITDRNKQKIRISDNKVYYQFSKGEELIIKDGIKRIETRGISKNEIIYYPDGTCSGGEIIFILQNNNDFLIRLNKIYGTAEVEFL